MTHGTKQRCKHDDTADRYACTTYISISHKKHTKWLRERDLQLQLHALSHFLQVADLQTVQTKFFGYGEADG